MEPNFPKYNHQRSRSRSPNSQDGELHSKTTHLFSNIIHDPSHKFDHGFPDYTASLFSQSSTTFISNIPTISCKFCREMIPEDIIFEHQNVCDAKEAFCQACGESLPLDMFDYHLETCQTLSNFTKLKIHDEEDNLHAHQDHPNGFENPENEWEEDEHNNHNHLNHQQYNLPLIHHAEHYEDHSESNNSDELENNNHSEGPIPTINMNPFIQFQQLMQAVMQSNNQGNPAEDDEDDWEDEMDEADIQSHLASHDPSTLTYEQLMVLDEGIVKKGLTETELEKFPLEVYLKECDGENSCTVCLTEYENGEVTRKLTCSHRFHKDCVDTWLKSNITCPTCKKYFR